MSAGQKARTRANFPHMKVRGGRRRHYQRATQTPPPTWDVLKRHMQAFGRVFEALGLAIANFAEGLTAAFAPLADTPPPNADDYSLAEGPR